MTPPTRRTTAEVWRALEKIADDVAPHRVGDEGALEKGLDEGALRKLAAQTDEELDRALREAGIEPDEAAKVGLAVLPGVPTSQLAKSIEAPPSRRRRVAWFAAAAALAALVVGGILKQSLEPDIVTQPRPFTPADRAAVLRDDAYVACRQGDFGPCGDMLNEAKAMDPAGETDPQVRAARQSIADALHLDAGVRSHDEPR